MLRAALRQSPEAERARNAERDAQIRAARLGLSGALLLPVGALYLQAWPYEERASVPREDRVEHVRFLEHMLLG